MKTPVATDVEAELYRYGAVYGPAFIIANFKEGSRVPAVGEHIRVDGKRYKVVMVGPFGTAGRVTRVWWRR